MSLVTTPGILLRSHPYSESSRILRFFTPDHGVVALIAKGARKRSSRGRDPIQTFGEGLVTFRYRDDRDLHTLRDFEPGPSSFSLGADVLRFAGASLVGEFLTVHALEEGDPELYAWVRTVLVRIASVRRPEVRGWVLSGGWRTLAFLGFPPALEVCVRCGGALGRRGVDDLDRFDIASGGLRCPGCSAEGMPRVGPVARADLMRLVLGDPPEPLPGASAHLSLMESFALHHLSPRTGFRSLGMLRPLFDADPREDEGDAEPGGER